MPIRRLPVTPGELPALSEILTLASPCFSMGEVLRTSNAQVTSQAWYAANRPAAFPFVLNEGMTVYKLGWLNGSSAAANVDIGIYDSAWNRKVSAGSTAQSGGNQIQEVDVADTYLPRGSYYVAMVVSDATVNRIQAYTVASMGLGINALAGTKDSGTTALPLPDPLTNMVVAATITNVPIIYIAGRVLL